jgi:head-tail adaptor
MGVFASLLNHTFTVGREVRTSDGQGGWAISYQAIDPVVGRLRPATGAERTVAASEERQISHVFYCLADADLERGDRVEYGGVQVEVLGIRQPSLAGHHLEIDCLEREISVVITTAAEQTAYWPGLFWPVEA